MQRLHPTTWLLFMCAMLLSACAQLGVPTPQTTEERIAATIVSVTAVRETTLTLLQAKKITPDDAENIQRQADNVRAGAIVARSLVGVDSTAADAKLQQTRAVLLAVQQYLIAKGK